MTVLAPEPTKTRPTYGDLRTRAEEIADERLKQRVLNGLRLLQETWGEEWVDKIDPATLDLSSCTRCVLGQLYGEYDDGVRGVGMGRRDWDVAFDHGFWGNNDDSDNRTWGKLTKAWKLVLAP